MTAARGILGTVYELLSFLWRRKLWWLIPFVAVFLVYSMVFIVGGTAGIGPFIYTLF